MRIIYTFAALLAASLLFLGNSTGPGNVQGQDRTGGPVANGFCGTCHAVGAFNPSMTLEILNGENPVTVYEPGATYTMKITVNADAGAQVYGFQAVALLDGNAQAGNFTAGMGTQVINISNRDYIEHSQSSTNNVFEVEWTAPASTSGNISFYAATMAGNGNGSSGGDGAAFLQQPIVLTDGTVATQELPELASTLKIYPNPVADVANLSLELEEATTASISIYSATGQRLQQYQEQLGLGNNQLTYDLSQLAAGHYVLEVSNGQKASTRMLVKQ